MSGQLKAPAKKPLLPIITTVLALATLSFPTLSRASILPHPPIDVSTAFCCILNSYSTATAHQLPILFLRYRLDQYQSYVFCSHCASSPCTAACAALVSCRAAKHSKLCLQAMSDPTSYITNQPFAVQTTTTTPTTGSCFARIVKHDTANRQWRAI